MKTPCLRDYLISQAGKKAPIFDQVLRIGNILIKAGSHTYTANGINFHIRYLAGLQLAGKLGCEVGIVTLALRLVSVSHNSLRTTTNGKYKIWDLGF